MAKIAKATYIAQLRTAESVLKGLLEEIGPNTFATALNNVCVHGEVFKENHNEFLEYNDYFLHDWFNGVEALSNAVKRHDTNFNNETEVLTDELDDLLRLKYPEILTRQTHRLAIMKKFDLLAFNYKDNEALKLLKNVIKNLKSLKDKDILKIS